MTMSEGNQATESQPFRPDQAITSLEQDKLGRREFAEHLAQQLLSYNDPAPLIVALYAPWGTGKSSLLFMVQHALRTQDALRAQAGQETGPVIIRFNPWNFSTIDQLIDMFFRELRAGLGQKDEKGVAKSIGVLMVTLATLVSPAEAVPGYGLPVGALRRFLKCVGSWLKNSADETRPLESIKDDVNAQMEQYGHRIFVFVDDVDRLEPDSMLLMFKLMRLVADFSNTTYVLAADRQHVENVLSTSQGIDGRRYMDKIVQVAFDIPPPEPSRLAKLLTDELSEVVATDPEDQRESDRWQEMRAAGLRRFIRTPRDVKRYVNGVQLNLRPLLGEVNVVDFLSLEAIRTFCPDVYEYVRENRDIFAPVAGSGGPYNSLDAKDPVLEQMEAQFAKQDSELAQACRETCRLLFPQLNRHYTGGGGYADASYAEWRRQRRICNPDFFDRYFLLRVPEAELSEAQVSSILSQSRNREALRSQLDQLVDEDKLERFLERLQDYAPNLSRDTIQIIATTLFDVGDHLPSEPRRMLEFDPRAGIAFSVSRLLERVNDDLERATTANTIAESTNGLSTLIRWLSLAESDQGRKEDLTSLRMNLLSDHHINELRRIAVERIRDEAARSALSTRADLFVILLRWKKWAGESEPRGYVANLVASDNGLIDLLVGFLGEIRSTTDSTHVQRIPLIRRKLMAEFIDPESLVRRVEQIRTSRMGSLSARQRTAIDAFLNPQRDDID